MDPTEIETRRALRQTIVHRMTDVGDDLVQMVHAQAKAQAQAAPAAPLSASVADYERAARTVRRCILLSERLDRPVRNNAIARRQVIRTVEDHIHRRADDDEDLHAELLDRLDRPEFAEELDDDRPVEAIINDIVRDLGLAAIPGVNDPWKRRTPEDIEILHARAVHSNAWPGAVPTAPHPEPPATPPPISTA